MTPRYADQERERMLDATRQALLEAATVEFAREGYVGANVNRIALTAGYAKGTLYNHFASKRDLMLALIENIATAHLSHVTDPVRQEADPDRRLQSFFTAAFDFVARYPSQARVMANNLFGPHAEFKQEMFQAYQPMFALVGQEIIAYGVERGRFRPLDPTFTANLLMTLYLGIASQVDPAGKPWLDPEQVADFCLHALQRPPGGAT